MTIDTSAVTRRITRLARSGALEQAWSLLDSSGLAAAESDPAALALRARLKKDRARQAQGSARVRWLEQSAADYLRAAELGGETYALINAASLSLLAGTRAVAMRLAEQVIAQIDANPDEGETPYWRAATRAEALLLLGRTNEARAALRQAMADAPLAWEDRAATIGQLSLICAELGIDAAWLDQFRPPRSLQFSGIMNLGQHDTLVEQRIADWLEAMNVGFAYGALAAGADIWVAEQIIARGGELHVILPCPVGRFRESSVTAVGAKWLPRFDRLLDLAASLQVVEGATAPSLVAVRLAETVALGRAIHNARCLQSSVHQLRVAAEEGGWLTDATAGVPRETIMVQRARRKVGFEVCESATARAVLQAGQGDPACFASAAEAWAAASAEPVPQAGLALDLCLVEDSAEESPCQRIAAIAEAASENQVLASAEMAYTLLAEQRELRIESMGEVRSATGFIPVFALRSIQQRLPA